MSAGDIASRLSLVLEGNPSLQIDNASELSDAKANSICFYENDKYKNDLKYSKAGLVIVPKDFNIKIKTNFIRSDNPYLLFFTIIKSFFQEKPKSHISKLSKIDSSAKIGENASIDEFVSIGKNVKIGANSKIYPNVVIYEDTVIGDNVILHSGVTIGADGFGFLYHNGIQNKISQIGNVVIGNDVEIGAGSTIDRATISSTVIGDGSKLDNLVQVGHNCKIGKNCCLCAQVGLAGNTTVGNVVYLAGQVGTSGHLKIGNYVRVGGKSGVMNNIADNAEVLGSPAIDGKKQKKIIVSMWQLPDLLKKIKKLLKKENKI